MEQDISNKTIIVLVVLTVIISILGTVVVLNEVSSARIVTPASPPTVSTSTKASGEVRLTVASREPVAQADQGTGYVTLTIAER